MYRDKVEIFDAISIIILMESSYYTNWLEGIDVQNYIILDVEKYEYQKINYIYVILFF